MNIVFINTHPIQYFVPLYQLMATDTRMDLKVLYLSDETVDGNKDIEFGTNVRWDIPMLDGYQFKFVRNNSWKPSFTSGFFGLINFGLIPELLKLSENSVVVIHGWAYFSNLLAIYTSKFFGYKVCLRAESPLKQENRSTFVRFLRFIFFKFLLFPFIDKFLFIGEENRLFYKKWGISDKDLIFTPYSVDNDRFRKEFLTLRPKKNLLRSQLNIPPDALVFLYSGKYVAKKRPLDLLQAILPLEGRNIFLVLVGEGELRSEMEKFVDCNRLNKQVLLTGFINQSEISKYYALSDVFVMCSGIGETWGLSVNEAMNFNLPLIISDLTGSSDDLVKEGENGYIFKTSNVTELRKCIERFITKNEKERSAMGEASYKIVSEYSFFKIISNVILSLQ